MTTRPTAASARPARPRLRRQGWLVALGLMAAAPALVATGLRVLSPGSERLAKLASFIPYGLVFWLPALILLAVAAIRAWRHGASGRVALGALSLACAAGLAATVAWQAPAFIPDGRPATTRPVTVVSLNVAQAADPEATARAVSGADVVVFAEAHRGWVDSLPERFRAEFRYLAPADGSGGERDADTVVFSRHPIVSAEALPRATSSSGRRSSASRSSGRFGWWPSTPAIRTAGPACGCRTPHNCGPGSLRTPTPCR